MKNEKWDDVHGNTTPDDRMVAFLESPTDSYAILQLREDVDDNIPLMFANYSYLQKKEMEPEIDRYEVVYHGSISMSEDVNRQLEDLYVKFNIDHPDDFRGHSMSVSDIVALKVVGEVSMGTTLTKRHTHRSEPVRNPNSRNRNTSSIIFMLPRTFRSGVRWTSRNTVPLMMPCEPTMHFLTRREKPWVQWIPEICRVVWTSYSA